MSFWETQIYRPIKIFDSHGGPRLCLDRSRYLANRVQNRSCLHVGCCDWPVTRQRLKSRDLLHAKLTACSSRVVGIDISPDGIGALREEGFANVLVMDAEEICLKDRYAVIVAGDVLEHMNNPGRFLCNVNSLLGADGRLVIGAPNAFSFNIFKFMLNGREPTHRDHTYYLSVKTLAELCSRYDLLPCRLVFTAQPKDIYEKDWHIVLRNLLLRICKRLAPSFIMEFQNRGSIDTSTYFLWR